MKILQEDDVVEALVDWVETAARETAVQLRSQIENSHWSYGPEDCFSGLLTWWIRRNLATIQQHLPLARETLILAILLCAAGTVTAEKPPAEPEESPKWKH